MIRSTTFVAAAVLAMQCGCTTPAWHTVARPSVFDLQREAVVHDPYASGRIAPPIVGGRPREFQKDFSEPKRARLLYDRWFGVPRW